MIVWTGVVRSWDAAIQSRNGMGTDTTHGRVGTQGRTHSTRWAPVWAMRRAAHDGHNPRRLPLKGSSSALGHVEHSPAAESHGRGCRTAHRRKIHAGQRPASRWHRGRRRTKRGRFRDGRQSRDTGLCGSDRVVRRSQQLAPCEHPPDSIAGREVTGKMRDYTAHMYSSQGHTSVQIRQAKRQGKEYAPHPPWLVLPDQASEPTLTYARAPGHRGAAASRRWGLRGCAPADTGAKIPFNLPIRDDTFSPCAHSSSLSKRPCHRGIVCRESYYRLT